MRSTRPAPLLAAVAAMAVLSLASASAQAQNGRQMMSVPMMDKNKDGMVSKQEFMDGMARVWDEKAGKMKLDGDRMRAADYEREVMMYLMAGG